MFKKQQPSLMYILYYPTFIIAKKINTLLSKGVLFQAEKTLSFSKAPILTHIYNFIIASWAIGLYVLIQSPITSNYIFSLLLTTFIFFTINLWYYFNTIYKTSKFTSFNRIFWQRTFALFWVIEGFLFLIVIYLLLVAPNFTLYFFQHDQYQKILLPYNNEIFKYCGLVTISTSLLYFSLYLTKYNLSLLQPLFLLLILGNTTYITVFELFKSLAAYSTSALLNDSQRVLMSTNNSFLMEVNG